MNDNIIRIIVRLVKTPRLFSQLQLSERTLRLSAAETYGVRVRFRRRGILPTLCLIHYYYTLPNTHIDGVWFAVLSGEPFMYGVYANGVCQHLSAF